MRHGRAGFKLGRVTAHRWALFRNLLVALFRHERITTTVAKAKAVRGLAEHMVTLAKRDNLHARRQVLAMVPDPVVVKKLFDSIAARLGDRNGGYTRILKAGSAPRGPGSHGHSRAGGSARNAQGEGQEGRQGQEEGGRRSRLILPGRGISPSGTSRNASAGEGAARRPPPTPSPQSNPAGASRVRSTSVRSSHRRWARKWARVRFHASSAAALL